MGLLVFIFFSLLLIAGRSITVDTCSLVMAENEDEIMLRFVALKVYRECYRTWSNIAVT